MRWPLYQQLKSGTCCAFRWATLLGRSTTSIITFEGLFEWLIVHRIAVIGSTWNYLRTVRGCRCLSVPGSLQHRHKLIEILEQQQQQYIQHSTHSTLSIKHFRALAKYNFQVLTAFGFLFASCKPLEQSKNAKKTATIGLYIVAKETCGENLKVLPI